MFIIYIIDLSTKTKVLRQGLIFLQKSKIQTIGNGKKNFQLIHFRKSYFFFVYVFFQKMLNDSLEHSFKLKRIHFLSILGITSTSNL